MRTYTFFIEDDRYGVPTLLFVTAKDERAARRRARAELADSPHYRGIEVREDDRLLFRLVPPVYVGHRDRRISN